MSGFGNICESRVTFATEKLQYCTVHVDLLYFSMKLLILYYVCDCYLPIRSFSYVTRPKAL